MNNIAEIVANPEAHGFRWASCAVHKGKGPGAKLLRKDAPCIEHLNVQLVQDTFGADYFLKSADGTSARVRDQRVTRNALDKNLTISNDELKVLVIEAALGQRSRSSTTVVTVKVYTGPNGTEFETQDEAEAAWEEYLASK